MVPSPLVVDHFVYSAIHLNLLKHFTTEERNKRLFLFGKRFSSYIRLDYWTGNESDNSQQFAKFLLSRLWVEKNSFERKPIKVRLVGCTIVFSQRDHQYYILQSNLHDVIRDINATRLLSSRYIDFTGVVPRKAPTTDLVRGVGPTTRWGKGRNPIGLSFGARRHWYSWPPTDHTRCASAPAEKEASRSSSSGNSWKPRAAAMKESKRTNDQVF